MAAGGAEVAVGLKKQTALNTPATGSITNIKMDEFSESVGYVTDEGRPEIGGSLAIISSTEKYGAAPFASMTGKIRLETIGPVLESLGLLEGGAGPFTYTPVTTSAAFPYHTLDFKYSAEVGNQYRIIDVRAGRGVFNFTPRQAPTFALDTVGGNHQESVLTHADPATQTVPSPAGTILAANSTFFGTTGFKVYDFRFTVENVIDNTRQPLGQLTPDDVVPTLISTRIDALLQMSNSTYRRLQYGGVAGVAAVATKETGAINMRITNGAFYIEFVYGNAEYFMGDARPTRAVEQVLVPVRARSLTTTVVTIARP